MAKSRKGLEKGTLVRHTIEGILTNLDSEKYFLSLDEFFLKICDNAQGGIKAGEEIIVRSVPDYNVLDRELSLIERLDNNFKEFTKDFFKFVDKLAQYQPRFTRLLSEEEQLRYQDLFNRVSRIMLSERFTNYINYIKLEYERTVNTHLSNGSVFVSRFSDGAEAVYLLESIDNTSHALANADIKSVDDFKEKRKYLERIVADLRYIIKKSVLKIKRASKKDLQDLLLSFDYFGITYFCSEDRLTQSQKKDRIQSYEKILDQLYVIILNDNIVGGYWIAEPSKEERQNIGSRKFRSKDNNIMIHALGCKPVLDKVITRYIGEVHQHLLAQGYWRVYAGVETTNAEILYEIGLSQVNQQDLPRLDSAMQTAGFARNRVVRYDADFIKRNNLKTVDGELIYRTAGTRPDHPGRSAL